MNHGRYHLASGNANPYKFRTPLSVKYSPKKVQDMVLPPLVKSCLDEIVTRKQCGNLLVCGGCGTGKTSLVKVILRELAVPLEDALWLTAVDERGNERVGGLVSSFLQKVAVNKIKFVVVDDIDSMSQKAQQCLIDAFHGQKKNVLVVTCFDQAKVCEEIQSKCSIIKLQRPSIEEGIEVLKHVAQQENLTFDDGTFEEIMKSCSGDMRAAVNRLELVSMLPKEQLKKLEYSPSIDQVAKLIGHCCAGDLKGGLEILQLLCKKGHTSEDIARAIFNSIRFSTIEENHKIQMMKIAGETCAFIHRMSNDNGQLIGCIASLTLLAQRRFTP